MIKGCTILPLYAAGYIIARFTKTPPFLDKNTYFPNYKLFETPDNFNILEN